MKQPDIRPGQVWADNDKRCAGRTLRVDTVDGRYAHCTVLTAAAPGGRSGHRVRLLIERMRPTSNGYRLLTEAVGETPAEST